MDLVSGLSAASTALGIVKDLREIDRSVDEASFKLKLAELTGALADTKVALSDARERINKLERQLSEAQLGDYCPICRNSHLRVSDVTPHDRLIGIEFHSCACDNSDCSYRTQRLYDANLGHYISSDPKRK